jgi:four helix bundle protein
MDGYRQLHVWQRSIQLAVASHREERFELGRQIRRSAAAVPALVSEGSGRGSRRDYRRYVYMAKGELRERETHLHIALSLGYVSNRALAPLAPLATLSEEVSRRLTTLARKLDDR